MGVDMSEIYALEPAAVVGLNGTPYELMQPADFIDDLVMRIMAYAAGPHGMAEDDIDSAAPLFVWLLHGVVTGGLPPEYVNELVILDGTDT